MICQPTMAAVATAELAFEASTPMIFDKSII